MPLNCELRTVNALPKVAVVTLAGAIDPRSISSLQEVVTAPNRKGIRLLVLDLGEIRYINSAGLAYLVNLGDALAARRGILLLAGAQPKVKVVFDLMGVSQFFKVYKSVDAALSSIAAARQRVGRAPIRKQA
ncbi:MAG TPA: STAS domain-containing protein [Planctomycetota bacterium]|jgi:anti-anti-sigma factor|nr:STAS domain-containing protein [Planctomycetota bacterium]